MLSKDLLQMFRKYKLWPEYRGSDLKSRTSEFFGFFMFPFCDTYRDERTKKLVF